MVRCKSERKRITLKSRKLLKNNGGGCGCVKRDYVSREIPLYDSLFELKGGACPCQVLPKLPISLGGYRPTKRNLKYLKKWKKGNRIGFTMRSSLKAKGLIPRANGQTQISSKYMDL